MKKPSIILFIVFMLCSFLTACNSRVTLKVDSFDNPYIQMADYKTFSYYSVNDPREQRLFSIARKVMEARGYVYDEISPNFRIAFEFGNISQRNQEYIDKKAESDATNRLTVVFVDGIYKNDGNVARILWQSETVSDRDISIGNVETCILVSLLNDFPNRVNSVTKIIELNKCKN